MGRQRRVPIAQEGAAVSGRRRWSRQRTKLRGCVPVPASGGRSVRGKADAHADLAAHRRDRVPCPSRTGETQRERPEQRDPFRSHLQGPLHRRSGLR